MESRWLGLIELFVVFSFLLGYGAIELYILRRDRRRAREAEEAERDGRAPPA